MITNCDSEEVTAENKDETIAVLIPFAQHTRITTSVGCSILALLK